MSQHHIFGILTALAIACLMLERATAIEPEAPRSGAEKVFDTISANDRESEVQIRFIRALFDLSTPEVSQIMIAALNDPIRKRGVKKKYPGGSNVMQSVVTANPEKSLNWLLDHFIDLNAHGRAGMIRSVSTLDRIEGLNLLSTLLADHTVIDRDEERPLLQKPSDAASDLRVADEAHNALISIFTRSKDFPLEMAGVILPSTPIETRDKRIFALAAWWKECKPEVTKMMRNLGEDSTVPKKIGALSIALTKVDKK